jgi:shikimate dehydrogenase
VQAKAPVRVAEAGCASAHSPGGRDAQHAGQPDGDVQETMMQQSGTASAITGHTRICAIIADPIHHVRTPQGINPILAERGIDAVLVPIHVGAAGLAAAVDGLRVMRNLAGFIVTVPHKTAMLGLCDSASDDAHRIGAVNVVRRSADGRLTGHMLDGEGFIGGLRGAGIAPEGLCCLLAGAGGAASAIAFALARAGVARLDVHNRSRERAESLVARVAEAHPACRVTVAGPRPGTGHDLVINATTLGLRPEDPLPIDPAGLLPTHTVCDIIMDPVRTALLRAADARGCRSHPGQPMLDHQLRLMVDALGLASDAGTPRG